MKKPFLRYADGKSPADLLEARGRDQAVYLCLPLSEVGKDFLINEADRSIRAAIDAGILNPRVLAVGVLDAWLKAARGDNVRDPKPEPLEEVAPAEKTKGIPSHRFASFLSDAIDWHRQNTKDPYNIDPAAIVILTDVRFALLKALK